MHCWGGGGRTGKVLAAWLVARHGMKLQDAVDAVETQAAAVGATRRADLTSVEELLK